MAALTIEKISLAAYSFFSFDNKRITKITTKSSRKSYTGDNAESQPTTTYVLKKMETGTRNLLQH